MVAPTPLTLIHKKMSDNTKYHIITHKEIMNILNVSDKTASKIKRDIKEHYGVVFPLRVHFENYFNLKLTPKT